MSIHRVTVTTFVMISDEILSSMIGCYNRYISIHALRVVHLDFSNYLTQIIIGYNNNNNNNNNEEAKLLYCGISKCKLTELSPITNQTL